MTACFFSLCYEEIKTTVFRVLSFFRKYLSAPFVSLYFSRKSAGGFWQRSAIKTRQLSWFPIPKPKGVAGIHSRGIPRSFFFSILWLMPSQERYFFMDKRKTRKGNCEEYLHHSHVARVSASHFYSAGFGAEAWGRPDLMVHGCTAMRRWQSWWGAVEECDGQQLARCKKNGRKGNSSSLKKGGQSFGIADETWNVTVTVCSEGKEF